MLYEIPPREVTDEEENENNYADDQRVNECHVAVSFCEWVLHS